MFHETKPGPGCVYLRLAQRLEAEANFIEDDLMKLLMWPLSRNSAGAHSPTL